MPRDQWRRVRGEQEIIVRYAPDEAIATLPALLRERGRPRAPADAGRQRLLGGPTRAASEAPTEQLAMIESIGRRDVLTSGNAPRRVARASRARKRRPHRASPRKD